MTADLRDRLAAALMANPGLHLDWQCGRIEFEEITDALLPTVQRLIAEAVAVELRTLALAARRPATEAEAAVERALALANELEADAQRQVDGYAADSDAPHALVGRSWVNACRQFRRALGGDR